MRALKVRLRAVLLGVGLLLMTGLGSLTAADGSVSGKVLDQNNNEALVGANILIDGTPFGAATDLDGSFRIGSVPAGTYSLRVTYIGYETKLITDVQVRDGESTNIDAVLNPASLDLDAVVVEVEASRSSDTYLITQQKNSSNIQDGISSVQISRNGDSNAAEAAQRISGVTVMDGKYIYVRGLGNRYTNTELNGAPMPSPEPDKKTVPLNMFPSALLESITAMKTYTPDLPGTFAGANVNIETKAYPDLLIFKPSVGTGYQSYPDGNGSYLVLSSGSRNFWGYDDGKRALPASVSSDRILDAYDRDLGSSAVERYEMLGDLGQSFNTGFQVEREQIARPISLGLSFGNRFNPASFLEWGFFANSTFSNSYEYQVSEQADYALYTGGMQQKMGMESTKSEYRTNTGLAGSLGMKLFDRHKLSMHYVYTHRSEDEVNLNRGFADNFDDGLYLTNNYEEKTINSMALKGDHLAEFYGKHRLQWSLNQGDSKMYQPDLKRLNYRVRTTIEEGDTVEYMQMDTYSWSAGPRQFTEGDDHNRSMDAKYQWTVKDGMGEAWKLKVGTRQQAKDRAFERRSFYHLYVTDRFGPTFISSIPSDVTVEYDLSDLGGGLVDSNYFYIDESGDTHEGLIVTENTTASDAYEAEESNSAGFFMVDVPLSLGVLPALKNVRFVGGLRYEDYSMDLRPYNPVTGQSLYSPVLQDTISAAIRDYDLLPSVNLIVQMPREMNIRMSFSRTVARPQFREVAPFSFQEFYGGDIVVGNPWLRPTNVYNYDLRYEWYPKAGEVIALSLFRKDFYDPIESSLIEASGKTYLTYANAEYCESTGIEFDGRRSLEFIPAKYGVFNLSGNVTYTLSSVEVDSTVMLYTGASFENDATGKTRPLQGQSDYVFNLSLHYNNLKGITSSLSYNTFSRRISALGVSGVPDEYEMPFHSLNFTASYAYQKLKFSGKVKNILNSEVLIGHENPENGDFVHTLRYKPGMSVSLSVTYDL